MATVQYWMNYLIYFQDPAEYEFAVAVAGGNILEMTPREAASLFGIPFPYPSGDVALIPKGISFFFPFTPGAQFNFPNPSGIFVDDTVLTKTIPAQVGGPDGVFTWSANIVTRGPAVPAGSPTIAQRRWIGGRELSQLFEGGTGISTNNQCRDFSRTIDGFGIGVRGTSLSAAWTRLVDEFRTGLVTRVSWERFYVRIRRLPAISSIAFWQCQGTPSAQAGSVIRILPTGEMRVFDRNAVGTEVSQGDIFTSTPIDEWNRIDILLRYGSGTGDGKIRIFLNGTGIVAYNNLSMDANTSHTQSLLGNVIGSDLECEIDLDDWINADLPSNMSSTALTFNSSSFPIDWLLGSHVRVHYSIAASQVNWAPAGAGIGVLNQNPSPETRLGTSELTSSTSGATLSGLTDALPLDTLDTLAPTFGVVAAIISLWSRNAAGTDGQLGYSLEGGPAVLASINQLSSDSRNSVAYLPTAMELPAEISPYSVVHTKSVDANLDTTTMMGSVVEYLGIWGPEDNPEFEFPISRVTFLHNARYFNSAYGYFASAPDAPTVAVGGTYVGNGTYQEFVLPQPCHFLWIRATSGAPTGGIKFFSAAIGPHIGATVRVVPNVRMWHDFQTFEFKFSVTGSTAASEVNSSGVTYQYIAFCDPGMRFNLCGAFAHGSASAQPKINPLIEPTFTPEAGFAQSEGVGTVTSQIGLWFRGAGHDATNGTPLNGAAIEPNFGDFGGGVFNSRSGLHFPSLGGTTNYSLWRTRDACQNIMVQIMSYVGNGTNPRTITLTPTSNRFPLFVMVCPTSATGNSFFRDPSHTGSNSSDVGSLGNSTTAITAIPAVDQITVNSSLNVNGVTYSIFAICGSAISNVNGTFYAPYCEGEGPYIPPNPPGEISVFANGGLTFNGLVPFTLLKDVTGIYTLVPGKTDDTLYDRQTGQTSVDRPILGRAKTGYIGG